MIKYVRIENPPVVGDIVVTKILKIERIVSKVTSDSVSVSALKDTDRNSAILNRLFNVIVSDFCKQFTLEEFFENHLAIEKEEKVYEQTVRIDSKEIANLKYRFGDIFINHDTGEKVLVKSVALKNDVKVIGLSSEDKTFDGTAIEYQLSEQDFLDNFYSASQEHKALTGSYTYTM